MAKTFYTVLEVQAEATTEAIEDAYRERVKETHPDVNDDPDAAREFRRVRTARDVLTDGTERNRYDRLGHECYVRRHVETQGWTTSDSESNTETTREREPRSGGAGGQSREHRRSDPGTTRARADWTENATGRRQRSTATPNGRASETYRRQSRRAADGGYARGWQARSTRDRSRHVSATQAQPASVLKRLAAVSRLGPWVVVHVVLLASAVATLGMVGVQIEPSPRMAVLFSLGSVALLGSIFFASLGHLLTQGR